MSSITSPLTTLWSMSLACKSTLLLSFCLLTYFFAKKKKTSRCFGLNMLTTLPLEAFVCREVMTNYWFPGERFNPNRHLIFTTSLVVTALTLSLLTCDLGAVFELIGATSACALAYILPPLCYIKLSTRSWRTGVAVGVVVFGVVVMVISVIQAIAKILKSKHSFPRPWPVFALCEKRAKISS